jgi:hypothetical protein
MTRNYQKRVSENQAQGKWVKIIVPVASTKTENIIEAA